MTSFLQISTNFPVLHLRKQSFWGFRLPEPLSSCTLPSRKIQWVCRYWLKNRVSEEKFASLGVRKHKVGIFVGDGRWTGSKRVVLVRFTGFNGGLGGGGGGGGKDNGTTARVLGNLTLAIGLTYLTMTGQLGWVLDAIVSVWLLAVLLPIVGLGAFLWWAGRDIVQGTCPNCGNGFQVFKSTLNDDLQLCPFCSQPFSVVGDEFVRDPVKFSNQSTSFEEAFSDRFPGSKKGKNSSVAVVDVEAEVKDAD